jgi:hypothetical protein
MCYNTFGTKLINLVRIYNIMSMIKRRDVIFKRMTIFF